MACMQCISWNLKDSAMRKYGFGLCRQLVSRATFFPPASFCEKFKEADSKTIAAREAALKGLT